MILPRHRARCPARCSPTRVKPSAMCRGNLGLEASAWPASSIGAYLQVCSIEQPPSVRVSNCPAGRPSAFSKSECPRRIDCRHDPENACCRSSVRACNPGKLFQGANAIGGSLFPRSAVLRKRTRLKTMARTSAWAGTLSLTYEEGSLRLRKKCRDGEKVWRRIAPVHAMNVLPGGWATWRRSRIRPIRRGSHADFKTAPRMSEAN